MSIIGELSKLIILLFVKWNSSFMFKCDRSGSSRSNDMERWTRYTVA